MKPATQPVTQVWTYTQDADGDHAIWNGKELIAVTDGWGIYISEVRRTREEDEANARLISCALGMAELAVGQPSIDATSLNNIYGLWRWTMFPAGECPLGCLLSHSSIAQIIGHVFDYHVMTQAGYTPWTLDQLCDWVKTVEPEEDADAARVLGERDHADRGSGPDSSEARAELLRVGASA
jgi:hypothetical protein